MTGPSLRSRMAAGELIEAMVCYDPLSARLAAAAGFDTVYVSGYALAAAQGMPDDGLLSFAEVLGETHAITAAVDVPVIADADDGYGGPANVIRAIREFEAAGVAGLHLEDQAYPKRAASARDKMLVTAEAMAEKARAAVAARRRPDLLIIARTDALGGAALSEALERARLYAAAGADVVMVHGIKTRAKLTEVARRIDHPLATTSGHWRDRLWAPDELRALGYRLVLYSSTTIRAAVKAVSEVLSELHTNRSHEAIWGRLADSAAIDAVVSRRFAVDG